MDVRNRSFEREAGETASDKNTGMYFYHNSLNNSATRTLPSRALAESRIIIAHSELFVNNFCCFWLTFFENFHLADYFFGFFGPPYGSKTNEGASFRIFRERAN